MTPRTKPRGHPAKQDADIARLHKTRGAAVELVRDLDDRMDPETRELLVAAALGLMEVYARLLGQPSHIERIMREGA